MADLSFSLDFDVRDAGLRGAASALGSLRAELGAGQRATIEFEGAAGKLRATIENVGGAAEKAGGALSAVKSAAGLLASAFAVVGGAIVGAGKALDDFGDKAIKSFGERSSAIRAYTTLLGSASMAETEFAKAQQLAARTDLTAEATQKAQQQLLVAGLRGPTKDALLLGGLDLASITPGDKNEALKSFARATGQVAQKGKLQSEELLQLAEGSSLGSGFVKAELQKILGVKDNAAVDKKLQKGEVNSDQGLLAIQRAILAQLGTQQLGQYATGSSGSLTGLISNRDESFENLLKSFDSEVIPAVTRYKEALTRQGEALDTTREQGQNAVIVLQDFSNTSIALKAAWTDFTTGFIESFTSSYTEAMAALGVNQTGLDNMGAAAMRLGEILGNVGTGVAVVVRAFDYMGTVINVIATGVQGLGAILSTLGEVLADLAAGDFVEVKKDYQRLKDSLSGKPAAAAPFNVVSDALSARWPRPSRPSSRAPWRGRQPPRARAVGDPTRGAAGAGASLSTTTSAGGWRTTLGGWRRLSPRRPRPPAPAAPPMRLCPSRSTSTPRRGRARRRSGRRPSPS